MILHAASGLRGKVIDLDTQKVVPRVLWVDTDAGLLEACTLSPEGQPVSDINGQPLTYRARGRFQFIPEKTNGAPKVVMGAPACVKCGNKLTLLGNDLCAFCNARDRGLRGFKVERLTTPLLDRPCQAKGCGRLAEYQVADEVTVTPELGEGKGLVLGWNGRGKVLFDRGQTVGQRYYCRWHYQPPRLLDAKGEEITQYEDAARP